MDQRERARRRRQGRDAGGIRLEGEKLLPPPVEKAIRASKIKPECWGKKVSVVFRCQLHGEATANPKVTSRNEGSNIMYIESQPATTIEAAAKASNKP